MTTSQDTTTTIVDVGLPPVPSSTTVATVGSVPQNLPPTGSDLQIFAISTGGFIILGSVIMYLRRNKNK